MQEAITIICKNIDIVDTWPFYPWDERKGWDRYGIKVIGDREIIDNPPPLEAKTDIKVDP